MVGSRLRFSARFLGRALNYTYEIREIQLGRRFVMGTAQGPFPMETTYTWEDAADGATRMTLRNRGEPSGFAAVTAAVMIRAMRKPTTRTCVDSKRSSNADQPYRRPAANRGQLALPMPSGCAAEGAEDRQRATQIRARRKPSRARTVDAAAILCLCRVWPPASGEAAPESRPDESAAGFRYRDLSAALAMAVRSLGPPATVSPCLAIGH